VGCWSAIDTFEVTGSYGASTGAKIAANTSSSMPDAANAVTGLERST